MISQLSAEATDFKKVVADRLQSAGGIDLLREYADKPAERAAAVTSLLESLGVWELRPTDSQEELEAAAAVCRAAGEVALPYPVAERLARPNDKDGVVLVPASGQRMAGHGDLATGWAACDLSGRGYDVIAVHEPLGTKLAPFAAEVTVSEPRPGFDRTAALLTTFQSWWLLGLLERAVADTVRYTDEREQFGRVLTQFQTVGFRLADMSVATHKLDALAKYTLWSLAQDTSPARAMVDALALRAAALESAEVVMRWTHQLHGAMGFCDETDVSWLSRASQTVRRLPVGKSQTIELLTRMTLNVGFDGLYSNFEEF
jgi:3-oxo-4-pregnene-20-carboxyl-CoA dehydrogenase alpha subunit